MIDTTRLHSTPHHHVGRTPPVGRLGHPQEIASAVRYLVTPEAAYVTGQTVNVNGGMLT